MKRFYEKEWQGIQFSTFATLSSSVLADAGFYNAFYRELFRRYRAYEELDAIWRRDKTDIAKWIAARIPAGARVLSVGAGLGYVEHCLLRDHGESFELHVQDFASDALAWLRAEIPASRIHLPGDPLTEAGAYDMIYLSAVDYAVEQNAMIALLADLQTQLRNGGTCLLISASFLEPTASLDRGIKSAVKETAKQVLEALGLYHRGQFWGWQRTQEEYRDLMRRAGYVQINDGFIRTSNLRSYFIEGRIAAT